HEAAHREEQSGPIRAAPPRQRDARLGRSAQRRQARGAPAAADAERLRPHGDRVARHRRASARRETGGWRLLHALDADGRRIRADAARRAPDRVGRLMRHAIIAVGLVLIGIGVAIWFGRISYPDRHDEIKIGNQVVKLTEERPIPQWLGATTVLTGLLIAFLGTRYRR